MINLTPEDTERYHELFKRLDTNSDGKIDVNDLVILFDKIKNNTDSNESNSRSSEKLSFNRESSLSRAKV